MKRMQQGAQRQLTGCEMKPFNTAVPCALLLAVCAPGPTLANDASVAGCRAPGDPTSLLAYACISQAVAAPKLTVALTGVGSGSVSSVPSGVDCGTSCIASFGMGTTITLTASTQNGSRFVGWSGACTGSATSCSLSLQADDLRVGANFVLATAGTAPIGQEILAGALPDPWPPLAVVPHVWNRPDPLGLNSNMLEYAAAKVSGDQLRLSNVVLNGVPYNVDFGLSLQPGVAYRMVANGPGTATPLAGAQMAGVSFAQTEAYLYGPPLSLALSSVLIGADAYALDFTFTSDASFQLGKFEKLVANAAVHGPFARVASDPLDGYIDKMVTMDSSLPTIEEFSGSAAACIEDGLKLSALAFPEASLAWRAMKGLASNAGMIFEIRESLVSGDGNPALLLSKYLIQAMADAGANSGGEFMGAVGNIVNVSDGVDAATASCGAGYSNAIAGTVYEYIKDQYFGKCLESLGTGFAAYGMNNMNSEHFDRLFEASFANNQSYASADVFFNQFGNSVQVWHLLKRLQNQGSITQPSAKSKLFQLLSNRAQAPSRRAKYSHLRGLYEPYAAAILTKFPDLSEQERFEQFIKRYQQVKNALAPRPSAWTDESYNRNVDSLLYASYAQPPAGVSAVQHYKNQLAAQLQSAHTFPYAERPLACSPTVVDPNAGKVFDRLKYGSITFNARGTNPNNYTGSFSLGNEKITNPAIGTAVGNTFNGSFSYNACVTTACTISGNISVDLSADASLVTAYALKSTELGTAFGTVTATLSGNTVPVTSVSRFVQGDPTSQVTRLTATVYGLDACKAYKTLSVSNITNPSCTSSSQLLIQLSESPWM